jgi:hypothetical protein
MKPPDPNPASFDSVSEKITDKITERAIFKPSTGSSTGADGILLGSSLLSQVGKITEHLATWLLGWSIISLVIMLQRNGRLLECPWI